MTYWFSSNNDEKRIQMRGRWTSLVQMLGTYRGAADKEVSLPGVNTEPFALLRASRALFCGFRRPWPAAVRQPEDPPGFPPGHPRC